MEGTIHKVGDVDDPDATIIRIVHISDTHMNHDNLVPYIPNGDILVHSGDFTKFHWTKLFQSSDHKAILEEANRFFGEMPHKHKIFVAGNHEVNFDERKQKDLQSYLPNAFYLQDSSVTVEGIHFYGTPWTISRLTSYATGFSRSRGRMAQYWSAIPADSDVIVSHMPPQGVLDLAQQFRIERFLSGTGDCKICGSRHYGYSHWGCVGLKEEIVLKARAKLHLFGHVHESNGVEKIGNVTFSNAAMHLTRTSNVFDFYLKHKII